MVIQLVWLAKVPKLSKSTQTASIMNLQPKLRFRLWHLLVGVVLVSASLFGVTEYGMQTAEIEVLRFDTDKHYNATRSDPRMLTLIEFQYLRPSDQRHISGQVHLRPIPVEKELEVGQRFVFRYRAKPLLWLKQVNPNDVVLELLGMRQELEYQLIIASGDRETASQSRN